MNHSARNLEGLALKVDVDTYRGLKEGVPRLLDLLERRKVRATFFVSLGPDHSGRAVLRLFTRKGFLKKMIRTRAPAMYGFRTLFYGTLLPAPRMAAALPDRIRAIAEAGHEVGIHCWDHVTWQDRLARMSLEEVRAEFGRARAAFREVLNREAESAAAPGWITSTESLAVQDEARLRYCSDTRGESPFFPVIKGRRFTTLQIPTTLPTVDEILGREVASDEEIARFYLSRLTPGRLHVLTVHAETEGMSRIRAFAALLEGVAGRLPIHPLQDVSAACREGGDPIPHCEVRRGLLPGRAGKLSLQGERID